MKRISIILIGFLFLMSPTYSQTFTDVIANAPFVVPNNVLFNGKIMVPENHSATSFIALVGLSRYAAYTNANSNIQVEGYFVLQSGGSEIVLSSTVTFSNSDFDPSWSVGSALKNVTINFQASAANEGTVKFKYRGKNNGSSWSNYQYSSTTYLTTHDHPAPETTFSGPSKICDEGIIEIVNPGTITFENISGLVTKTDLPNNQYKLTRIGSANGVVIVKSVVGANTYTKNISIGGRVTPGIKSMTNLQDNPTGDRFVVQEGSGNYKYSGTLKLENVSQVEGMSTSYSWSLVSGSTGAPFISWHASGNSVTVESKASGRYVKLQCVITSGCASFTKEYTFYTGFGPL